MAILFFIFAGTLMNSGELLYASSIWRR
ncbi:hypothetical protein LNP25_03590 [Klebsiella variicola subsp. variicola]|nr:hypothetical protein [Klebsiella variicola subsp. variicola]